MIATNPPLPLVYTSNVFKYSARAIAMVAKAYKKKRVFLPDGGGWEQKYAHVITLLIINIEINEMNENNNELADHYDNLFLSSNK